MWKDREIIVFTVKSGYKILRDVSQGAKRDLFVGFWRLKAQPSTHLIAWRILEDKIATKANMVRRGNRYDHTIYVACAGRRRKLRLISFVRVDLSSLCGLC